MRILVTGGAGFIGSHLCEELDRNHSIRVIDNLSSGKNENVSESIEMVEADIKSKKEIEPHFKDLDTVFHFAANPKVKTFPGDKDKDFEENLQGTKNVLDACIENNVDEIVFASSSVVYGEETEIPTPEDANLDPISMYGATKAGGEHMCKVYSQIFDIELSILRLANIVGRRNRKGVIYDFIHKLKEKPEKLEILGNGKQRKSYLHIENTVEGIIHAWKAEDTVFNIGSRDSIDVDGIAEIVSEEMNLNPKFSYTGGEKGWEGDVPEMRLDISKLENEGWKPERNSRESVTKTVKELLKQ
ncbi:MAG: UDP-glucose 4-epimerase [Nanohaloarchaea archaeon SW_7_43_1]|nr:MAG: UDP-glucose 4-epimerase [Nanohaloarchaea archaeon SW_7_43_1]